MNDTTSKSSNGRKYWQSLTQLAESPAATSTLGDEFTNYDPEKLLNTSRRKFLKLAGASMALAGITLTGCRRWPKESVVEQNSRPVGRIPGVPEQYATVWELGGVAYPLLVTTYDGRPIKVDGNPMHPATATFGGRLGSSNVLMQASLLDMYDPERARVTTKKVNIARQPIAWETAKKELAELFASYKGNGEKIAVLTEETRSPTNAEALAAFKAVYPGAKVYEYEAVSRDNELAASKLSFNQALRQVYDLKAAKRIVSFDADILGQHPNALRYANDWAQGRKSVDSDKTMNRLYVIESSFTVTGSTADERLPATVRLIEQLVLQLASKAGLGDGQPGLDHGQIEYIDALWEDLKANQGAVLIAGGYTLRPEVLGVINALNDKLGSYGKTITLIAQEDRPTHAEAIKALVDSINTGAVETILILGGNPAYDAPADLKFADALGRVKNKIALSLYDNETTYACDWHVNRAHYLESWGDATMFDGSVGVQQPTIEPLFGGKTVAELLSLLAGEELTSQDLIYRTWGRRLNEKFVATSESFQKILHDGFVAGTPAAVTLKSVTKPSVSFEPAAEGFELRFEPDYKTYDGRFANNGWLQECPHPLSKVVWDNPAYISYADAQELGVKARDHSCDVIEIEVAGKKLSLPAYVMPGQPKGVITLPLGYARKIAGAVLLSERPGAIGAGVGYDTYSLRTSRNPWVVAGAKVTLTSETISVASTGAATYIEPLGVQIREERVGEKMQGGLVVHESTLAAYLSDSHAPHQNSHKLLPLQLFPSPYAYEKKHDNAPAAFNEPHAWGMAIDMNTCIGCQACVVACQAENNIPIVGRDEVIMNRNMHWLRIDRYFKGPIDDPNPQVTHQPMMCVHCENAPCEQVCPVAATVHDSEGLNTMVYNRCIGTRYCANNCPYRVRRFNFLDYQSRLPGKGGMPWLGIPDQEQEESIDKIKALVFNPDVTVRMRGVMEKCTYCVQRIKSATNHRRIEWLDGKREKPTVDDFDVVTACQTACPTEAIVFGDLNDPNSLVSRQQKGARSYQVLQELNNRPRTQHLAKLRNPVKEPVASSESKH